jgi:hypothetical protein
MRLGPQRLTVSDGGPRLGTLSDPDPETTGRSLRCLAVLAMKQREPRHRGPTVLVSPSTLD